MRDDVFAVLAALLDEALKTDDFMINDETPVERKRRQAVSKILEEKIGKDKTEKFMMDVLTTKDIENLFSTCTDKIVEFKKNVLAEETMSLYESRKAELEKKELFDKDKAVLEMMHGKKIGVNGIEGSYLMFDKETGTFKRCHDDVYDIVNIGEYGNDTVYYILED